jgi:hypothetical protein
MGAYLIHHLQGREDFFGAYINSEVEFFNSLEIPDAVKQKLIRQLNAEVDFEISTIDLETLVPALDKKIETLLKHPDFDPYKERFRERYPDPSGVFPFRFKDNLYYLRFKGPTTEIDVEIFTIISRKGMMLEFIEANKPLKYTYHR